jgi:hypothetical protein
MKVQRMVTPQMEPETPELEIARLRRELAHANEQCRVAHAMAMDYRTKYRASEKERASLERKLERKRAKQKPPEPRRRTGRGKG